MAKDQPNPELVKTIAVLNFGDRYTKFVEAYSLNETEYQGWHLLAICMQQDTEILQVQREIDMNGYQQTQYENETHPRTQPVYVLGLPTAKHVAELVEQKDKANNEMLEAVERESQTQNGKRLQKERADELEKKLEEEQRRVSRLKSSHETDREEKEKAQAARMNAERQLKKARKAMGEIQWAKLFPPEETDVQG